METGINWAEDWVEVFFLLFLIFGFITSILLFNPWLSYLSIVLAGFVAGRVFYIKRYKEPIFPLVLIIVGFLLGYILGGFWISRFWALLFFAFSWWLSFYLHRKKIFTIFKSEGFVK
ncbi:MAG: hypothetical protein AABY26_05585 [Nanoarchaeota archaeon]|mgnify:CR=1 FL=1